MIAFTVQYCNQSAASRSVQPLDELGSVYLLHPFASEKSQPGRSVLDCGREDVVNILYLLLETGMRPENCLVPV